MTQDSRILDAADKAAYAAFSGMKCLLDKYQNGDYVLCLMNIMNSWDELVQSIETEAKGRPGTPPPCG